MFRQREIGGAEYKRGLPSRIRINNDAVYHTLQFNLEGLVKSDFDATPSGPIFDSAFPFSLMQDIRIVRNGSDVVWQGSGAQLAHEHQVLNSKAPAARLYSRNETTKVETLLTKNVGGMTIPSNSEGIACNTANFEGSSVASTQDHVSVRFKASAEMWFQVPLDGSATTNCLVDARELSTFIAEITWADHSSVIIPGTNNTKNTIEANVILTSMDQDNVAQGLPFGTFKRSSRQINNFAWGAGAQQVLLDRGNYQFGFLFDTKAFKAASALVPMPENNVIKSIRNNINTNFALRDMTFETMQSKAHGDEGAFTAAYAPMSAGPYARSVIRYTDSLDNPGELIMTQTADVWEMKIAMCAIGEASNGVNTPGQNPIIDMLSQEIIPGVTVAADAPQGARNGSIGRTTAKPYAVK